MYTLEQTQFIPTSLSNAWEFFSTPKNLQKITPPDMKFEIVELPSEEHIFKGMKIRYKVRPLLGIPMKWVTQITRVEPNKAFIDFQEKGPFSLWEHLHEFREVEGGVEMHDLIKYKLPMGFLGRIVHSLIVRKRLENIFVYRKKIIDQTFGTKS